MKKVGTLAAGCVLVALTGFATVCFGQGATDCSSVSDDKSRLKCYDEQANRQKPKATVPVPAAPSAVATPTAPAPANTKPATATTKPATATSSEFGLGADAIRKKREAQNPEAPKEPEQLVARVKSVAARPQGMLRITMEDGQVWEETQRTGGLPPEEGESVTIKRGMLGSYFLSRTKGLALRVKRIR